MYSLSTSSVVNTSGTHPISRFIILKVDNRKQVIGNSPIAVYSVQNLVFGEKNGHKKIVWRAGKQ